ncbi:MULTISPECIES: hypothetical protein [Limnobaculum]|nr:MULTISPECIES: hypothetical protein [Limnobaculum]
MSWFTKKWLIMAVLILIAIAVGYLCPEYVNELRVFLRQVGRAF